MAPVCLQQLEPELPFRCGMVLGRKRGDALPVKALADAAGRQAECAESWLACWQVLVLVEIEIDGTGIKFAKRFLPEHGDAVFLFIWPVCRAADEDGQAALWPVGIARAEAQAVDALVDDAAVHEVVVEAADFDLRVGVLVLQVEARERQVLVARLVLAVALVLEHRADARPGTRLDEGKEAQAVLGAEDGLVGAAQRAGPPVRQACMEAALAVEEAVVAVQCEPRIGVSRIGLLQTVDDLGFLFHFGSCF